MTESFAEVKTASKRQVILIAAILTSLCAGCDSRDGATHSAQREPASAARDMTVVLERRLALMPAVARWKWERGLPIEDRAREAIVITDFVNRAEARGLDRTFAERLITEQIDAAKVVQRECFQRWRQQPPPADSVVLDLSRDVRPQIDRLTEELIDAAVCEQKAKK